jgi:hypothetical protein
MHCAFVLFIYPMQFGNNTIFQVNSSCVLERVHSERKIAVGADLTTFVES